MKCSQNLNPQFVFPAPSVTPAHAVRSCHAVSILGKSRVAESQWTQGTWMSWMEMWLHCGVGGVMGGCPSDKWCNAANTLRICSLFQRCLNLITTSYFPPCFAPKTSAQSSPLHLADVLTITAHAGPLFIAHQQQTELHFVMSGEWTTSLGQLSPQNLIRSTEDLNHFFPSCLDCFYRCSVVPRFHR